MMEHNQRLANEAAARQAKAGPRTEELDRVAKRAAEAGRAMAPAVRDDLTIEGEVIDEVITGPREAQEDLGEAEYIATPQY
jgi:hypothetical protein